MVFGSNVRVGHRINWKPKARSRRCAIALTGLLLALAVLAGLAHAGGRYFYCEGMRLMQSDPCLVSHTDKGAGSESTICPLRTDCCELWTLPSMPLGTMAEAPSVPSPAVLAVVPASQLLRLQSETPLAPLRISEQWRRPPRSPGNLRARLMVFLT